MGSFLVGHDLARELSEVQNLDQSHELETRVQPNLIMHATDRYPPRLVEAILRCLSIHLRRKNGVHLHAGIGPHVDHDVQVADFNETRLPSQKYYDQYTGLELDPVGTAAARQSEIDFAWRQHSSLDPGRKRISEWDGSLSKKGDEQRPELRSRLVVQETRQTSTISVSDIAAVTSSTPPLEVVRLFCSLMMSMKGVGGEPLVLQILDVSRAYPHAEVLRDDFCVETVPEMGLPEDTCLLARRGWYGMRGAAQAFEFAVRDHFLDHDFKQGMLSTCVFAHRSKFLLYFVNGDDYVGLGVRGHLEGYKAKLSERFIIKDRGILGADGLHEIRILNRVITYNPAKPGCAEMLTYEADQGHADLLMAAYGLNVSSKGKAIPWEKANFMARHPLAGPSLDEKRRVEFRSNCMRCLYLALDRPDIQFTAKEISRAMASPTVHADETLKALSRYLASHPRVLWRYPRQEWTGKVLG